MSTLDTAVHISYHTPRIPSVRAAAAMCEAADVNDDFASLIDVPELKEWPGAYRNPLLLLDRDPDAPLAGTRVCAELLSLVRDPGVRSAKREGYLPLRI